MRRSSIQRQRRRRRWISRLAILAVVVVVASLAIWAESVNNGTPTARTAHSSRPASPPVAAPHVPPTANLSAYGRALAPAAIREQVVRNLRHSVVVKQPLKSGMLFAVRSGQVLWERHPNEQLPIASLTKMMTALVVIAHSKPSAKVMITKQAVDFTGSGVGLLPRGKRVPESALLYGLLLPSGNDAAIALAQHVGRTQAGFIREMNRRAAAMGLTCTHYTTVSGVIDQGNHSCAVDLAELGHAVLRNRVLAKIVGSEQAAVKFPIKGGKLYLTNNNPLYLAGYLGTDGVKTGYTTKAGMCLVAAVKRGHRWLGVVLLHSANWLTQAEALLNAGFAATR
jgi:serine-type D-Ala-D-Ala carboxypeptidase (penicillin-binding protein 5/6)